VDRRGVLIELTPRGMRRVDSVLEHHLETEVQLIASLSTAEQRTLADLLRRLLVAQGDVETAPVSVPARGGVGPSLRRVARTRTRGRGGA
jgi:hypothetical protein